MRNWINGLFIDGRKCNPQPWRNKFFEELHLSEWIYVRVCLTCHVAISNPNREVLFIYLMNYQNGVFQVIFCMGKDVHRLNNHQQSDKPKPIRTNAELTKTHSELGQLWATIFRVSLRKLGGHRLYSIIHFDLFILDKQITNIFELLSTSALRLLALRGLRTLRVRTRASVGEKLSRILQI